MHVVTIYFLVPTVIARISITVLWVAFKSNSVNKTEREDREIKSGYF